MWFYFQSHEQIHWFWQFRLNKLNLPWIFCDFLLSLADVLGPFNPNFLWECMSIWLYLLYIQCVHESFDKYQCIYLPSVAAHPSVPMMSWHPEAAIGIVSLLAYFVHIPLKNTVPWKHSPWTSSALDRRSRQDTYMCCIVLVMGPSPQAGSTGRHRTPSCCLSFFT